MISSTNNSTSIASIRVQFARLHFTAQPNLALSAQANVSSQSAQRLLQ